MGEHNTAVGAGGGTRVTRAAGRRHRPLARALLAGALPAVVLLLFLAAPGAPPAGAAGPFQVTRFDDPAPDGCQPGDCSLREAVIAANAATTDTTIVLPAGVYHLTRPIAANGTPQPYDDDTPETGDLDFKSVTTGTGKRVTVTGAGTAATIIDANFLDRAIDVGAGDSVLLRDLSLRNGQGYYANIPGGEAHTHGGAIHNHGSLRLEQVAVTDSTATLWQPNGGGVFNAPAASLELVNVTVARNRSLSVDATVPAGGGLESGGSLTAINTTIVGNTATTTGGLKVNGGFATLQSLILADNPGGDCGGAVDNLLYRLVRNGTCTCFLFNNIAGADPQLLPVPNPAGYVYLYAPRVGSPVIDSGDDGACPGVDANAVARPQDGDGDTVAGCDMGAAEFARVTVLVTIEATSGPPPAGLVTPGAGYHSYDIGTIANFTAASNAGHVFLGWQIEHRRFGWASPMTLTVGAPVEVIATFAPRPAFTDVPPGQPYGEAVGQLAARGLILGYGGGRFGPGDGVQRAQMAALIARATSAGPGVPPTMLVPPACVVAGSWDCEDWGNTFTDRNGLDGNLWRNVGTLQRYGVTLGYAAGDCAAQGRAYPCYGPTDPVTYAQTITFITRMMKVKGYWVSQPGAPLPYAGVPGPHQEDVRTFAFYTQGLGGVPAPPSNWNAGASRGWFAQALWQALNSYRGTDAPGLGGYVP